MKKFLTLLLALTMCVALVACGSTNTPSADDSANNSNSASTNQTETKDPVADEPDISERTIRFSSTSADGTSIADAMYLFADTVSELSGGKMVVEVYTNSQLGDGPQALQNAQLGVQEMTMTQPTMLASKGATDLTAVSLPYVFRDLDHQIAVINGEIGEKCLESVQQADGMGLVGIGYWSEGSRNFFTTKPVTCIEDIAGMKLRCMQVDVDTEMVRALGASPTPIAFGELYSALQTKVVDGAENPLDGIYSSKFYEVCKYVTMDEHTMPPTVIVFSESIWNQMTADEQQVIRDAWKVVADTNYDVINDGMTEYKELLEAEGVEIIELNDKEKWSAAMTDVYAQFGADCSDVIDAIMALK